MGDSRIIIVDLCRPKLHDPKEMRSDPFWEFGSFGCTKCHQRNLMDPKKARLLNGARLAFAQGGPEGVKLVHLTPPIRIVLHQDPAGNELAEARWTPHAMPFTYAAAPLLIDNDGRSAVLALGAFLARRMRKQRSWMSCFASAFRSRGMPLCPETAGRLVRVFERACRCRKRGDVAGKYWDALPCDPPVKDRYRRKTYLAHLRAAGSATGRKCC